VADHHVKRMEALFDLVADEYDEHVPFFTAYAERFVPWLGVAGGDRVLDIGVGRGAVAREAEKAGARVVGVDISMAMLRTNRVPCARMDAQRLGVRDNSFDVVAGAFSIHLLPDPGAGVAEAVRALRPGGTFGVVFGGRTIAPKWDFYKDMLKRYSAYAVGEPRTPSLAAFGDPWEVLGSAGLVEVEVTEGEVHVPVPDAETFVRGELAHGFRSLFDAVPQPHRRAMELELLRRLDEMRISGGIVLDRAAVFAKGRKPLRRYSQFRGR